MPDSGPLVVALARLSNDARCDLAGLFLAGAESVAGSDPAHARAFAELAVFVAAVGAPELGTTAEVLRARAVPETYFGDN